MEPCEIRAVSTALRVAVFRLHLSQLAVVKKLIDLSWYYSYRLESRKQRSIHEVFWPPIGTISKFVSDGKGYVLAYRYNATAIIFEYLQHVVQ